MPLSTRSFGIVKTSRIIVLIVVICLWNDAVCFAQSDSLKRRGFGPTYQNGWCFGKASNLFKKARRKEGTEITAFHEFGLCYMSLFGSNHNNGFAITGDYAILNLDHQKKNANSVVPGFIISAGLGDDIALIGNVAYHFLLDYGAERLDKKGMLEWSFDINFNQLYGRMAQKKGGPDFSHRPGYNFRFGKIGQDKFLGLQFWFFL